MAHRPDAGRATDLDVVVLLGTRWSTLRDHGTRWRAILKHWAGDSRIARLTVVDYPRFTPKWIATPWQPLASWAWSWHDRIGLLDVALPMAAARRGPLDRLGWTLAGRQARSRLETSLGSRLVVATTPIWVPLMEHIDATRTCFDAVDDWRGHPLSRRVGERVGAGYSAVTAHADRATAVSTSLAETLRRDFGIDSVAVPNGVDLSAYGPSAPVPDGLPDRPFAVYVGVVQERVDVDLLVTLAAALPELPVVVAGPAAGDTADRLRNSAVHWLGPVHVDLIPGLLRRAAVGLVPHHVNDFTRSMNPMKVFEYLAAGLPVVTTPVPGIAAVSPRVIEADQAGFVAAVVDAARKPRSDRPDPDLVDRDWSRVADELLTFYCA